MLMRKYTPVFIILFLLSVFADRNFSQESNFQMPRTLPFQLCREHKLEKSTKLRFASDNVSKLFILDGEGTVSAFDINNFSNLWNSETGIGETDFADIFFEASNLYTLSKSGINVSELTSLSVSTGIILSKEVISENRGNLRNIFSGKSSWLYNFLPFSEYSAIMSAANGRDKFRNFFDQKSGNNGSHFLTIRLFEGNRVFLADDKGLIQLYDLAQQKILWSMKLGGKVTSISIVGKNILLTSLDNFVYYISSENGERIWKKRLNGRISEKPLIDKGLVILTVLGEKTAFALDISDGKQIGQIDLDNDMYFVKPVVKLGDNFVFQTTEGLSIYSQTNCLK
jgi:outer membrane protein assembly factor BamB